MSLTASSFHENWFQFQKKAEMEEEGEVVICNTVDTWKTQIQKATESRKLVVADFTASWCAPCRQIDPVFGDLAKKFPSGMFLKVDVDENKSVSKDLEVNCMPTFLFLKDGKPVEKVVGANKELLQNKVAVYLSADYDII